MAEVDGKLHYYGVNPDVSATERKRRFAAEATFYDEAANILTEEERKRFTFCSRYNPWEFVNKFNQIDHAAAVFEITDHARRIGIEAKLAKESSDGR
jgi:DNA-directed RNA polymerase subunit F